LSAKQSYNDALASVEQTLTKLKGCTEEEKSRLRGELAGLRSMQEKMLSGRVEIVIFGEISTGKSALINALVGSEVSAVDVRGGWTKEVWHATWKGAGYTIPGLGDSQVVLIDTPGINEVGGGPRGEMARDVAQRADLILFVTDSDLNETEYTALIELTTFHKPILLILNKIDLYSREQRNRLREVLTERLRDILPTDQIVTAAADPREKEYIIQAADGSERSEWRRPGPDVEDVKAKILQLLEKEGLALVALNAALYASDQSDKVAALRVQLRNAHAEKIIWSMAGMKAVAVGLNPIPVADVLGGLALDGLMIVYLAEVYNLQMSTKHAQELAKAIGTAAGGITISVVATHGVMWFFKTLTPLWGTLVTALPQGAAAGYGTYIVGKAAKFYFENGSSWGTEGPKTVVTQIIGSIDKDSIMQQFKNEIGKKLLVNRHSKK